MKKEILVVADPNRMHANLEIWANEAGAFELTRAATDEQAIEMAHQRSFDLVVVDRTADTIDIKKLKAVLPILNDEVHLLGYDGEPMLELNARIKAVFDQKRLKGIQGFLVLDASDIHDSRSLPRFSAN